jgi:Ribosome-associated protein Y (PSrp-1)
MISPQITYRGMAHSPAMDARIVELASKLEDLHPRITRCHVVVDETDRHKSKGNLFEVHVDLHVPGCDIAATRQANADAYVAISQAFDVLTRQLEDVVRRQRGETKNHPDRTQEPRP